MHDAEKCGADSSRSSRTQHVQAFYTNVIVWVNIQEKHPHTNILPSTGTNGMSEAEIDDRIYGSKITFTIEESMVVLQMLCKVCMCLLFMKLT